MFDSTQSEFINNNITTFVINKMLMLSKKLLLILAVALIVLINMVMEKNQKNYETIINFAQNISTDLNNASYDNVLEK
ncbi:MAG: hypothetical protein SNJ77_05710 [Cytophagales bacterium]